MAIEGRRGFDRISLSRFAGWGAASGLLLSGIFVVGAALRGASLGGEFLTFGPGLAMASAVCAAGSLALARRAERRELPGPSGDPAEAELTEDEERELLDAVTDMSAWHQPAASEDVAHPHVDGARDA